MRSSVPPSSTPRPYLSWSQLNCFETSPELYTRKYLLGEEFVTAAMTFGKDVAEGLEADETDKPEIEHLRTFLPTYPKKEYEIRAAFAGVPIMGRLDQFDPWKLHIGEVKTGRVPWTQARVDRSGQLLFYALLVRCKYGKTPREIALHWAPTEYAEDGSLHLTGDIVRFTANITLQQVLLFARRVSIAWTGIKELTKNYYRQIA